MADLLSEFVKAVVDSVVNVIKAVRDLVVGLVGAVFVAFKKRM